METSWPGVGWCCSSILQSLLVDMIWPLRVQMKLTLGPPHRASSCLGKQWPCRKQDTAIQLFLFIKGKQPTIAFPTLLPGQLTAVWICSRSGWIIGQEEVTWSRKEKKTTTIELQFWLLQRNDEEKQYKLHQLWKSALNHLLRTRWGPVNSLALSGCFYCASSGIHFWDCYRQKR